MPTDKAPSRRPAGKARVERRAATAPSQPSPFQARQAELEAQNQALRRDVERLQAALSRHTSLYESAPVACLTLDKHGAILDLNPQAATLLGGDREPRGARFDTYLAPGHWPAFSGLLASVALNPGVGSCEVEVLRPDGSSRFAQITAAYHAASEDYLLALMDITARHDSFQRMHDAESLAQQLLSQNRHLTRRMFELVEEDRRRVVQEMHQELDRGFAAIYHEIAMMLRVEHRLLPETRVSIRTITASLAEMQNGMRRIMLRLRPTLLDLAGIGECVREFLGHWQEQSRGTACELTLEGDVRGIPDAINIALFRAVQEAMGNVARHAKAGRVSVRLSRSQGQINLVVDDNGEGFDTATVTPGMGLLGMRERVIALDGQFELASQPGRGTRVELWLPTGMPAEEAAALPGWTPERRDGA